MNSCAKFSGETHLVLRSRDVDLSKKFSVATELVYRSRDIPSRDVSFSAKFSGKCTHEQNFGIAGPVKKYLMF